MFRFTRKGKIALITGVLLLSSCIPKSPEDFKTEDELYNYTMQLVENDKDLEAVRFLKGFRNRFPLSPRTPEVELKIGDLQFQRGEFIEAVATYRQFLQLHPSHPKVPYAILQTGRSYVEQIPSTIDRDQTNVFLAIEQFDQILTDPKFGEQAKKLHRQMHEMLAKRERYIADYYLKRKKWRAAETRLKNLASNYEFQNTKARALADLVRIYAKLDRKEEAQQRLEELKALGAPKQVTRAQSYLKK